MTSRPPTFPKQPKRGSASKGGNQEALPSIEARCDVVATVRDCIDRRRAAWDSEGIEAGIELPCGPLPWLALDEPTFRHQLERALDKISQCRHRGLLSVALWRSPMLSGRNGLHVEIYTEEPDAGVCLDIALDGGTPAPLIVPIEPPGIALLVEEHPAKGRVLQAQCVCLGMEAGQSIAADGALDAFARAPHRFIWLAGADVASLASAMRCAERRLGFARARIVASCHPGAPNANPDIDAVGEWPLSLDRLRAWCSATPWSNDDAFGATRQLFLRESRRDLAIIRDATAIADWATVIRHAHRIKGGTVLLGEDGICELAERVEQTARRTAPPPARMEKLLSALELALRDPR